MTSKYKQLFVYSVAVEIIKKVDRPNIKIEFVSAQYVTVRVSFVAPTSNLSSYSPGHISRTKNGWKPV